MARPIAATSPQECGGSGRNAKFQKTHIVVAGASSARVSVAAARPLTDHAATTAASATSRARRPAAGAAAHTTPSAASEKTAGSENQGRTAPATAASTTSPGAGGPYGSREA